MDRVSHSFQKMRDSANLIGEGVGQMSRGFEGLSRFVGMGQNAIKSSIKEFVDFEEQMGAVRSAVLDADENAFQQLRDTALQLGSSTQFSSKQVGLAMEALAKSGMDVATVLRTIKPVLAAAGAEGMDLGKAADIVVNAMSSFKLGTDDAARVSDAFAYVANKTTSSIDSLAEGLKYAQRASGPMKIGLEDTLAVMGMLHDVGVKGSASGTAFANAMQNIARQSKRGIVSVGGLRAKISYFESGPKQGQIDVLNTFKSIADAASQIPTAEKRVQALTKLVSVRGATLPGAFEGLSENATPERLKKVSDLFDDMQTKASGFAGAMQTARMENIWGDFKLADAAISNLKISVGQALGPMARQFATFLMGPLTEASQAFQGLSHGISATELKGKGLNTTVVDLSSGIVKGIGGAKWIFEKFIGVIEGVGRGISGMLSPFGVATENGAALAIELVAIGVAAKTTANLFKNFVDIGVGGFKLLVGGAGLFKGAFGMLAGKFPTIAAKMPSVLGKLGGVLQSAEKMTAPPVRVVNFDELRGLGFGGGPLGTPPTTTPGPNETGSGGTSIWNKPLGKGFFAGMSGASKALAGLQVAAAGVGSFFMGWEIGTFIDRALGLSDKISEFAAKGRVESIRRNLSAFDIPNQLARSTELVKQLQGFTARGISEIGEPGAKETISQEFARQKVRENAMRYGLGAEQAAMIQRALEPMISKLPTAIEQAMKKGTTIGVSVQLDGKEVGKSVAALGEEQSDRLGEMGNPGSKTAARR
jgi:TP901 family phage tail tape measure protein